MIAEIIMLDMDPVAKDTVLKTITAFKRGGEMKDDFFWCFILWFSSILIWGWMLTVRIKWIRTWVGGFSIVCNFFLGLCMSSVFFRLSETYRNMDGITTFPEFVINTIFLLFIFAPMFIMGLLLRKAGKMFDILQNKSQNDLQNSLQNDTQND